MSKSFFDNPLYADTIKKALSIHLGDLVEEDDEVVLSLVDELPGNIDECDPDLLTKFPLRYAFICRLRDLAGAYLRNVQRKRKQERGLMHRKAIPTPGEQPKLPKTTDKYVEHWIDTQPDIMDWNEKYDNAETQFTILCSAVSAMEMYYRGLQEYLRRENYEQRFAKVTPPPSEERKKELDRIKTSLNKDKKTSVQP